jgi:hypothetical protein
MEKKRTLPTEKQMIYEIVFSWLAIRKFNIIIEMTVAENSVHLSTEINVTEEHLRSRTFEINLGRWDIWTNGTNGNPIQRMRWDIMPAVLYGCTEALKNHKSFLQ